MDGARLHRLSIKGYRSIDAWVHVDFPTREPLVLIGENNAGKSNILRALNFLFGDFWPGSHQPEDHEFFGRSPEGSEIKLLAGVSDIPCGWGCSDSLVSQISWKYAADDEKPLEFTCHADCHHTFVNNPVRQALFCMSVGVNRDLSYQLSYNSKWTTLSKLMRRFHDRLVADEDRVERLHSIFDSLVATFHEVEEFESFTEGLRRSFADFGGNLRYGLGIDFSAYDPSNYFRSLRVFPHMDGAPRTYEELGTGQEQILAMAFAHAYAEAFGGDGLILAVEEPEAHLHPLAQQWLASKLRQLANTGVQVVVTTHSPYFVDLSTPWATVLVRKDDFTAGTLTTQFTPEALAAKVIELGASADRVSAETVGGFYESASTYDTLAGFFSRGCVLVEGPTEQAALPILLGRVGLDLMRAGISVVPVEGITNMPKWVRLFRAYGLPVYAVFDTDSNKPQHDQDRSLASAREVLGALETDGEPQLIAGELAVFNRYARLDANYEFAMGTMFGDVYTRLEEEAGETVGRSKQLRARYCARNLPDPDESTGWQALRDLANAIRGVMPEEATIAVAGDVESPARTGPVSRLAPRRS